ncbi:YoaK family protein [Salinisphaera hydrothermalis]|uniref:DUF1275 domain-containing protein n=1 Tax=Salinisphaera hydrothermalis (strain C41B8) TaxID=1304275 RepID=A0A084IKR8_SALHC|nr:YoaK family protein [Salinisphaera hydrothermalis]KEZ77302.1 hypothetical protein C41B8_10590 [Salinisphaera hydrothermalis C41B8]
MITHRRRERAIAVALTGLAGYVDALGFMTLGGYFIAFMSGNTTRLGVGAVRSVSTAVVPAAVIILFVLGVVGGSLVNHRVGAHRRAVVMGLVTLLLALSGVCQRVDFFWGAIVCMALAMGAENTVFERNGEVSLGVTYMTGTLVKLGQRLTSVLLGGDRWAWAWYFLLWVGLLAGTVLGSLAYLHFALDSLWFAVALGVGLTGLLLWWAPASD